jgi:hypothetical protein
METYHATHSDPRQEKIPTQPVTIYAVIPFPLTHKGNFFKVLPLISQLLSTQPIAEQPEFLGKWPFITCVSQG